MTLMSFIAPLCGFLLGSLVGCIGGIALGFVWYEHKSGLFNDPGGKRSDGIRFELDDVFARKNSEIEASLSQEAKLRRLGHSITASLWERRMGNGDAPQRPAVRPGVRGSY
jgi:hypothetical protein